MVSFSFERKYHYYFRQLSLLFYDSYSVYNSPVENLVLLKVKICAGQVICYTQQLITIQHYPGTQRSQN